MAFSSLNSLILWKKMAPSYNSFIKPLRKQSRYLENSSLWFVCPWKNSSLLDWILDYAFHIPLSAITINLNLNDDFYVENVAKIPWV